MEITHDEESSRFVTDHDEPAYLAYEETEEGNLDLTHTIVPVQLEGKGVGSALVQRALAHARKKGVKVIPSCQFVQTWLKRHPDHSDLVG